MLLPLDTLLTALLAVHSSSGGSGGKSGSPLATAPEKRRRYAPLAGQGHGATSMTRSRQASRKRGLVTCEQIYGLGSLACGSGDAAMCFSPSLGQTCCAADNGYCEKGQYCAPVPGYCCGEADDLQQCAKRAGFRLPLPTILVDAAAAVAETGNPSSATDIGRAASPASPEAADSDLSMQQTLTIDVALNSSTPHVQISAVARKEQWTLMWMAFGIGVVGVIMATF